jgi:hypothetical protein
MKGHAKKGDKPTDALPVPSGRPENVTDYRRRGGRDAEREGSQVHESEQPLVHQTRVTQPLGSAPNERLVYSTESRTRLSGLRLAGRQLPDAAASRSQTNAAVPSRVVAKLRMEKKGAPAKASRSCTTSRRMPRF